MTIAMYLNHDFNSNDGEIINWYDLSLIFFEIFPLLEEGV